jgi:GNAT superfamily N-acetyltransferase
VAGAFEIRPMREADLRAVHETSQITFRDLDERLGEHPGPAGTFAQAAVRLHRLLATDPGGAWVAEHDGQVVGCALAILREGIWGLSLFVVLPEHQSAGLGRELLARAWAYGEGARGAIILASRDVRAIRAYLRLGLELHPAAMAIGRPRGVPEPREVRPLTPADREWVDAVGRAVRGAAHAGDLDAMLQAGSTAAVVPERGYGVWRDGALRLLAAADDGAARELLRAHLRAAGRREALVEWLTSRQQWAIRECLKAGLRIDAAGGAVLTGGRLGPMAPYLPSGAYL